jgi:effector-binding domain-containing protein
VIFEGDVSYPEESDKIGRGLSSDSNARGGEMKIKAYIAVFAGLVFGLSGFISAQSAQKVEVNVKEVEPFIYCCLTHKGPISDIQDVIGQLILDMQTQNIQPMGPMVGIFQGDPTIQKPESAEWEVGFPVIEQAVFQPPLIKKQWIFKTVAVAMHIGPYENTPETIGQILIWMDAHGYAQNGPVMERYTMDPAQTAAGGLKTEIWIPCQKN